MQLTISSHNKELKEAITASLLIEQGKFWGKKIDGLSVGSKIHELKLADKELLKEYATHSLSWILKDYSVDVSENMEVNIICKA